MKTVFKYFAIAAAAVATLVSCNKEIGTVDPVQNQEGIVLKFASDRPALIDANTKTVYNNGTIEWSTGDKIKVGITVGGVWMAADGAPSEGKTPKFYVSDELQEGASTFTVSNYFTLQETGTYKFYGLYPSSASSSSDIGGAPSVSVTIPATQTPAANSFDNAADLMIAVSASFISRSSASVWIGLVWLHMETLPLRIFLLFPMAKMSEVLNSQFRAVAIWLANIMLILPRVLFLSRITLRQRML